MRLRFCHSRHDLQSAGRVRLLESEESEERLPEGRAHDVVDWEVDGCVEYLEECKYQNHGYLI
jgi:hypothetical protein